MTTPLPVVLVHGAWHGAWCFAGLQHALDELGVASYAIDLPGHGCSTVPPSDLYGDAQLVVDVLARLQRPTVLVGHSYGGAVITEAATRHPDIAHLVYLAAFALDEGESVMGLLRSLPRADVALGAAMQPQGDGSTVLDHTLARHALYGSCSGPAVDAAIARLSPQPMITFGQPVTGSPRDTISSTYVRCLRDQSIHVTHQDAMATRCRTVITLDTDHSPFMSKVAETAALLHEAACA